MLWQASLVALMGCSTPAPAPDGFEVSGTVHRAEVEGGVYLIVARDSTRFQPIDLPAGFRRDGLRVRATLRRETDVMTAGQAGEPVSVVRITIDTTS